MEEKKEKDRKTIEVSNDLIEILDMIRNKIKNFTWGIDNSSYYTASKILAKKVRQVKGTGLFKEF